MKRKAVLLFFILGIKTVGYSQDFALKTNGLYWATTPPPFNYILI